MEKKVRYRILCVICMGVLVVVAGCIESKTMTGHYTITVEMVKEYIAEITVEGPPRYMELGIFDSEECEEERLVFCTSISKSRFEDGKHMFSMGCSYSPGDNFTIVLLDIPSGYEIQRERVTVK